MKNLDFELINQLGWWCDNYQDGWDGWFTGMPAARTTSIEVIPSDTSFGAGDIASGKTFSLTLHGVGFPLPLKKSKDLRNRQRIKIVAADQTCAYETNHPNVKGLGCTKSTQCTPRPNAADATSATWEDISISGGSESTQWKICHCAGKCHHTESWYTVDFQLTVQASSPFEYDIPAHPLQTVNRLDGIISIVLRRKTFVMTGGDISAIGVKLVRNHNDCLWPEDSQNLCGDSGGCVHLTAGVDTDSMDEQTASFEIASTVEAGDYLVCVWTGSTMHTTAAAVHGTGGLTIRIEALAEDAQSTSFGVFHNRHFSTRASATADAVFDVSGSNLAVPSTSRFAITDSPQG